MINYPSMAALQLTLRFRGIPLGPATGFLSRSEAGEFVLVTNRHVVTGRHQDTGLPLHPHARLPDEIQIRHHGRTLGEFVDRVEPLFEGCEARWREHPQFRDRVDVVALPLSQMAGISTYVFPESLEEMPHRVFLPTDIVSAIGYPFGKSAGGFPIWTTGCIASEPAFDFDDLPVFLIDCRTRQGQSGSIVVSHVNGGTVFFPNTGKAAMYTGPVTWFLGVYSGRVNGEADLGRVWRAACVMEVLHSGVASSVEHPTLGAP